MNTATAIPSGFITRHVVTDPRGTETTFNLIGEDGQVALRAITRFPGGNFCATERPRFFSTLEDAQRALESSSSLYMEIGGAGSRLYRDTYYNLEG